MSMVFENNPKQRTASKGMGIGAASCPKCNEMAMTASVSFTLLIPVLKFFKISKLMTINIHYCSRCGYLKVTVDHQNI